MDLLSRECASTIDDNTASQYLDYSIQLKKKEEPAAFVIALPYGRLSHQFRYGRMKNRGFHYQFKILSIYFLEYRFHDIINNLKSLNLVVFLWWPVKLQVLILWDSYLIGTFSIWARKKSILYILLIWEFGSCSLVIFNMFLCFFCVLSFLGRLVVLWESLRLILLVSWRPLLGDSSPHLNTEPNQHEIKI